jgi:hypothetical protein
MEAKVTTEEKIYSFLQKNVGTTFEAIESGTGGIFKLNIHKALKKLVESKKIAFNAGDKTYKIVGEGVQTTKNIKVVKELPLKKEKVTKENDEATLTKEGGRDTSKYVFNKIAYPKSRAVLEVIRQYVKDHPKITLQILQTVFRGNEICKRYGLIIELTAAKKHEVSSGRLRHFTKNIDIINVNGRKCVVTNQVDASLFDSFCKISSTLKYSIKKQQ